MVSTVCTPRFGSMSRCKNRPNSPRPPMMSTAPGSSDILMMSHFVPGGSEVGQFAVRCGNDALHPAGLIADLNAHAGCDIESSFAIDSNAIGTALIRSVGHMQPVEALFVIQRPVSLNEVAVNPVRAIIGNVQQCLIGRERHAIRVFQSGINHNFLAIRFD